MSGPTLKGRILSMMAASGLSYRECCKRIGSRGGKASAEAKRRRRLERERIEREQKLQEAMGLR